MRGVTQCWRESIPHQQIQKAMKVKYEFESVLSFTAISIIAIIMMLLWSLVLAWPVQLLLDWLGAGNFRPGEKFVFLAFWV